MKILHIHISLSSQGGIETFVASLSNEQAQQGHDVHVLSVFQPLGGVWERFIPLVHKHTLGKLTQGFSLRFPYQIYRFIRQGGYDIVHVHGFIAYYAISIALLHRNIKFVYTVHNDAFHEGNKWDQRLLSLKRFIFRHHWAQAVTISQASQESFVRLYGFSAPMIYNGIDLPKLSATSRNDYELILPARIAEAKNHLTLCRVVTDLIQEGYPLHLTLAGDKQNETIFRSIQPYLNQHIEYIGSVSDIPLRLQQSGALCMPSIWEGMPMTVIEALSCGCLPVCTPVGGIPEMVHDAENGFLSQDTSEQAYKEALLRYLRLSSQQRSDMRKKAIQTAQNFSMAQTAKQYLALYLSLNSPNQNG